MLASELQLKIYEFGQAFTLRFALTTTPESLNQLRESAKYKYNKKDGDRLSIHALSFSDY